jgi:predicted O-linked N-acetylglucosamine transferase (SPINDLY family)
MQMMEQGDLCLDSFHFGGCNTIVDALFLRRPTVTWEGNRWYSRIGSQMLRQIGMAELVATNRDEYVKLALRLIEDENYRESISQRLERANLDETTFSTAGAGDFRQAIEYLLANHESLKQSQDRTPIRIPVTRPAPKGEPARRAWGRSKR